MSSFCSTEQEMKQNYKAGKNAFVFGSPVLLKDMVGKCLSVLWPNVSCGC